MMLVAIDTGLTTTKVAALTDGGELVTRRFPSSVARGLVGEQGAGVYCIGRTQPNFQLYSVLARAEGLFPIADRGFRESVNARRRVLIEHGVRSVGATGKIALVLTHPVADYYRDGVDNRGALEGIEQSLLKMQVAPVDPAAGRPVKSAWSAAEVTVSPESVWAVYDLAISSPATAQHDLAAFEGFGTGLGAVIAMVDFGSTGTRISCVEWTSEPVPTVLSSRSRQIPIGGAAVAEAVEQSLIDCLGYRDFVDLVALSADPAVAVSGERVDATAAIEEATRGVFDQILGAGLASLAEDVASGAVQFVLFVGGASHLLGRFAREALPPQAVLDSRDPSVAPVRGLLKARAALSGGGR